MDVTENVLKILSTGVFKKMLNADIVEIAQLNAAIAVLIRANIDYDLFFTAGTRRSSPEAILTIWITPCTNIDFTLVFGPCGR